MAGRVSRLACSDRVRRPGRARLGCGRPTVARGSVPPTGATQVENLPAVIAGGREYLPHPYRAYRACDQPRRRLLGRRVVWT